MLTITHDDRDPMQQNQPETLGTTMGTLQWIAENWPIWLGSGTIGGGAWWVISKIGQPALIRLWERQADEIKVLQSTVASYKTQADAYMAELTLLRAQFLDFKEQAALRDQTHANEIAALERLLADEQRKRASLEQPIPPTSAPSTSRHRRGVNGDPRRAAEDEEGH